jgi:hypothetical protein
VPEWAEMRSDAGPRAVFDMECMCGAVHAPLCESGIYKSRMAPVRKS